MSQVRAPLQHIALDATHWLLWARIPAMGDTNPVALVNEEPRQIDSGYIGDDSCLYAYALIGDPRLGGGSVAVALWQDRDLIARSHTHAGEARPVADFARMLVAFPPAVLAPWLMHWLGMRTLPQAAPVRELLEYVCRATPLPCLQLSFGSRCAPHLYYLEGQISDHRPFGEPPVIALTHAGLVHGSSRFMQLSEDTFAFTVTFKQPVLAESLRAIYYLSETTPVGFSALPTAGTTDALIAHLEGKPAYQKQTLRRLIARALWRTPGQQPVAAAQLLERLELQLTQPVISLNTNEHSVQMHIEQLIPLGTHGVFASGWLHDPLQQIAALELHSALGFSFPLNDSLFHLPRPDVAQHFGITRADARPGWICYACIPESQRQHLTGIHQLHRWHMVVRLRNGASYEIHPPLCQLSHSQARDIILKAYPGEHITDTMLQQAIAPAVTRLQQAIMTQTAIASHHAYGPSRRAPRYALCIPLYERLDFIAVQLANFASDPDMQETEIIYVLDSPWQEAEVRAWLEQLSLLYPLSLQLAVMQANSGYAAATNAAASLARADYLVLLNSDVFPTQPGWLSRMAAIYDTSTAIGTLAPKLLYEDDSLQHAGMYFAQDATRRWLNHHYYKGFPRHYPPAQHTRAVPAVSGACLMIARAKWQAIGGMRTDYVIGDFEDSDLCLRAAQHGWESWYCAEAELYHPERQSVPLNDSYHGSLAWRINAHYHTACWDGVIRQCMQRYGAAS